MSKGITQAEISAHANAGNITWHGDYFSMTCPFHDDESPSCLVYSDGFSCQAAGCREYGSLWKLKQKLNEVPLVSSVLNSRFNWRTVCDLKDGQYVPRLDFIAEAEAAAQIPDVAAWYERRGIASMVESCQLGWWRGWFVTPVFDARHQPLRLIFRSGPSVEGKQYLVSPGPPVLYVPDWGLLHTKPTHLLVPFGCYDAITLAMLRYPAVTGAGPCLGMDAELFRLFRRRIHIIPDGSPPQELDAARHIAATLGWRGKLDELDYPNGDKDPNDFAAHGHILLLEKQLGRMCYE